MKRWPILFLLLWVANAVAGGLADPGYEITTWTSDDGLPSDAVIAVAQTPDGYLWVGTNAGLARFDGVRFKVFDRRTTPQLSSDQCGPLMVDAKGVLWIATMGGAIAKYENGTFTAFGRSEGSTFEYTSSMLADREGRLWLGTNDVLHMFDGARFTPLGSAQGVTIERPYPSLQDARGRVWVQGVDAQLGWFKDGVFHEAKNGDGIIVPGVTLPARPLLKQNGELWWVSSTPPRVMYPKDGGLVTVPIPMDTADGIGRVLFASDNTTWVGMRTSGLRYIRDGKLGTVNAASGLPFGPNTVIAEDREGNIWAGTSGGLSRIRKRSFASFDASEPLGAERTWAVFEDRAGDIWCGTDSVLWRVHEGKAKRFDPQDGLPGYGVTSLAQDAKGAVWIGTSRGLAHYDGTRLIPYGPLAGVVQPNVRALAADRKGRLWIGTTMGAVVIDDGRESKYTVADGLAGDWVRFIMEDSRGDMWLATTSGVSRLHGGEFTTYRAADGLGDDRVMGVHEGPPGTLWFGTYRGGLTRFRDGKFATISAAHGLHDNTVLRILEDDRGRLWMSSPRGVFRVERAALEAVADGTARAVTSVAYDKSDGMPTTDCGGGTQPSGWRARDGRLWFPTGRGITVVDPAEVGVNATPPPVHVEDVLYDRIHPGGPQRATLPPGTKSLELHYTANALAEPDRARFKYKLEPFDPDWVDAGARRVAYYTVLRPGTYRFHVIAANESGVWNDEGAAYDLRVEPFFYETPAFFAAIVLLVGLLAWAAYRLRVRQLEARYAAVLSERGRIARELHDTIAQGFTGVSMQLEAVSSRLGDAPEEVRDNLDRARLLVRSSLADARRSVKALRPHLLESRDLAASLRAVAEQLTAGTGVTANVTVNGSKRRLPREIEDALFRVGQEAMTNAIRHGRCKTIDVAIQIGGGRATLSVQDDGAGFDTAAAGDGSGLAGMKERLDKLDGSIAVTSAPGRGTRVEASVPA